MLEVGREERDLTRRRSSDAEAPLLGDYQFEIELFKDLDRLFEAFDLEGIANLNELQRIEKVNDALLELIRRAPLESFLFAAVVDYIDRVIQEGILDRHYSFSSFEQWLNCCPDIDAEEHYQIRAKIVGKHLPREEYQAFFPIGMGRKYSGTHFVTAHSPPDLDTTVASFWGWMDAFGARVGEALHVWNVPGGEPPMAISRLFHTFFGLKIFTLVPRHAASLTVSAIDLMTQKKMLKQEAQAPTAAIDQNWQEKFIILVDKEGTYQGCWRSADVEGVRLVTFLLNNCWRWFENTLHVQLISLFTRDELRRVNVPAFVSSLFDVKIKDCEPVRDLAEQQKHYLEVALIEVLDVKRGLEATFTEFAETMAAHALGDFADFRKLLEGLTDEQLFDTAGLLIENRPRLFHRVEQIIKELDQAIQSFRNYVDQLGISIAIKHCVLREPHQHVSVRSDLEEIHSSIGNAPFIAVVSPTKEGRILPIGVIESADLHRRTLGTVSLRDFCNRDEVKIAPYLEIISVIDHHRANLQTSSFPTAILGDVQSCNVLLAEQMFLINDRYSLNGMTKKEIEQQLTDLSSVSQEKFSSAASRLMQRLIQRRMSAHAHGKYFIHPKREICEYLSFIHAIFDDTDLLERVTMRDILVVVSLINRLKSLMVGKEVEIIQVDDIPRDTRFAKMAARRILEHPDVYSLYKTIYAQREVEVEEDLLACAQRLPSTIFTDTKEQKNCACVGQTKLFMHNFPTFNHHAQQLRQIWIERAQQVQAQNSFLDLHVQMITTIAGAEEVYRARSIVYHHQDELWLWVPDKAEGYDRLAAFLSAFRNAPEVAQHPFSIELVGDKNGKLAEIFAYHFTGSHFLLQEKGLPGMRMAILRFNVGVITSRKTSITPYIPSVG